MLRVERVTADGIFVFAQQPFWYDEADGASSATYFVTNGSFARVGDDDISQRYPGTYAPNDSGEVDQGQSIRLFNFAGDRTRVSVRLTVTDESTPETALNETYTVEGTSGIRLLQVASRPGNYTLTVTTDAGASDQLSLTVTDGPPAIAVYVSPDGSLHVFSIAETTSRGAVAAPQ
ncbi:hypothetical protein BRD00_07290 [Halobacteriales archaeon QS_8_69_26]|nr:MAG: hypothetical protein BRD00_07290 [Halobacteriales archaeon QS_8_69_26]